MGQMSLTYQNLVHDQRTMVLKAQELVLSHTHIMVQCCLRSPATFVFALCVHDKDIRSFQKHCHFPSF